MAKRNSDGDVLSNKTNVLLAKKQRLLASWLGPTNDSENANEKLEREREREAMEDEMLGPEQFGIDAEIPKSIKDGSFTQRPLTSKDKLLETLIGKKAAKAHIAAQQTTRKNATPIKFDKPVRTPKPAESDDEDEGRTAAFKSKRQRTRKPMPMPMPVDLDMPEAQEDAPETDLPHRLANTGDNLEDATLENEPVVVPKRNQTEDDSGPENTNPIRSRKQKPISGSYLDEILAERSKKKKKK
ncbi:hypothetical protein K505DRAFT_200435, partial [Melanomma pulvis-pyrius CBS 109.77]